MSTRELRTAERAAAAPFFYVWNRGQALTIDYLAKAASRYDTAVAHAMLHAVACYRAYGGRCEWRTA